MKRALLQLLIQDVKLDLLQRLESRVKSRRARWQIGMKIGALTCERRELLSIIKENL